MKLSERYKYVLAKEKKYWIPSVFDQFASKLYCFCEDGVHEYTGNEVKELFQISDPKGNPYNVKKLVDGR